MIQENLKEALDRYKSLANLKRTPREFSVGDKVFLRVKIERSAIKSSKLFARYVGPFTIIQKVNFIAYQLEFPNSLAKMHNVFHVSLLKTYIPDLTHIWDVNKL